MDSTSLNTLCGMPVALTADRAIAAACTTSLVFLASSMSSIVGSVVDMKVAMEHQADGDFGYAWLKTNSAGSGAYVIKSWKPNEAVVLEANPTYRGGAAEDRDQLRELSPEPQESHEQLQSGGDNEEAACPGVQQQLTR